MSFKKAIGFLIILCQFLAPLTPCYANPFKSIDEIEKSETHLRTYTSLPTSLNFKAQKGRTAAGILLYAGHEGKVRVLLGKRNDSSNTWCNFGGESEDVEGTENYLAQTAARETEEESRRFYSFHPYLLRNQPYIDTHSGTLFYRMYWQRIPFIDPAVLRARSGETAVQQEFTDFQWVEADSLLDAVLKQKPLISGSEPSAMQLYPELFSTLSTPAGRTFLQSLVDEKKISRFKRHVRPYINRLYWIQDKGSRKDSNPMASPKWPTVVVNAEKEAVVAQELAKVNLKLSPLPICAPSKEKDSFASAVFEPNKYERVDLDQTGDKSILARSVAAHAGMLIELKKEIEKRRIRTAVNLNDHPSESYSDMSLRIILGPDYKTKEDFPESLDPQGTADEHNIKTFVERYYRDQDVHKLRGKVDILESDLRFMKTVLRKSRQHGLRPTFYHATSESLYGLYLFFTHLREFMIARPLNGLVGLRGIDTYFHGIDNMKDVITRDGYNDYSQNTLGTRLNGPKARQNIIMCANCTAFAGLSTTQTSSSSLEYVLQNHSVAPPDLGSTIQEALALSGFEAPTNSYFASLFSQFVSHNPDYANSVMLSLFMEPELLDNYTYAARGGGYPYTQTVEGGEEKEEKVITLPDIFEGIRGEAERQRTAPESFEVNKKEKMRLVPEARILLHPEIMYGDGVHVDATPRFPMKGPQKSRFEHLTHLICMAMIGDWLSDGNQVLEGTFLNPPVAKMLFHRVHFGVTGIPEEEKVSFEGFFHLVRHGLVEAVETYAETFPAILEEAALAKDRVLVAALKSDSPKMLEFVFKRLPLSVSEEEITKLMRVAKDSHWIQSLAFLANYLEGRDMSERFIPVLYFLLQPDKGILGYDLPKTVKQRVGLMQLLVPVTSPDEWFKDKLCQQLLSEFSPGDCAVLCGEIFFPSKLLQPEDMLHYIQKLFSTTSFGRLTHYGLPYQRVFLHFLRIQDSSQLTHNLFGLTGWLTPLCKDLLDYVSEHPEALASRNIDGLTVLGATQKAYLGGHSGEALPSILSLYRQAGIDVSSASYPPFLQLYGTDFNPEERRRELLLVDSATGFVYEENREWVRALANATPGDYSKLLETCPDIRLFYTFRSKLEDLVLHNVMDQRQTANRGDAWVAKVYNSLSKKRQGPTAASEDHDPFSFMASLPKHLMNPLIKEQMGMMQITDQQFPEQSPARRLSEDETTEDLSVLFSDIPEGMLSLGQFIEELDTRYFWREGITDYLKSLPEYLDIVVPAFEGREKKLAQKKEAWIKTARQLAEENDADQLYDHVRSMPYLSAGEYKEISALLAPFSPTRLSRNPYPWELYSVKERSHWLQYIEKLLMAREESGSKINDFLEQAPASALRAALVLFLKKERAIYLPKLLMRAYRSAHEFAEEYDFRLELRDSETDLPETYRHPFPYILMNENPTKLVRIFLPLLDDRDASKLLRGLDEQQFFKILKRNKARELQELVDLIPWAFQWGKFFLLSIRNMAKPALRQLVLQSLDKLKTSETEQRFLPYFVYLMMDGQNADIVKDALNADPTLLDIKSLDGMDMEDFLKWYASLSVAKVVRDFQKEKSH